MLGIKNISLIERGDLIYLKPLASVTVFAQAKTAQNIDNWTIDESANVAMLIGTYQATVIETVGSTTVNWWEIRQLDQTKGYIQADPFGEYSTYAANPSYEYKDNVNPRDPIYVTNGNSTTTTTPPPDNSNLIIGILGVIGLLLLFIGLSIPSSSSYEEAEKPKTKNANNAKNKSSNE